MRSDEEQMRGRKCEMREIEKEEKAFATEPEAEALRAGYVGE